MRKFIYAAVVLFGVGIGLAVDVPNTFTAGTPIKAAEMNANFTALKAAVTTLENKVAAQEATITNLTNRLQVLENKLSKIADGQYAMPSDKGKLAYVSVTSSGNVGSSSFTPSGDTISTSRNGTGSYTVSFTGVTGNFYGNVQLTSFLPGHYCGVNSYTHGVDLSLSVSIKCYDGSGNLSDTSFLALILE